MATVRNLGSAVVGHSFVLDQKGQPIVASGVGKSHAVVLAPGVVPTNLAYRLPSGQAVPSDIPTVAAGSGGKFQFTDLVRTQVNQELAQYGEAAVSSGRLTFLVKPLPAVLGASGGTATPHGTSHAWRAALSSLHSNLASKSGSGSTSSTSTAASATPSSVPTTVQAQTVIPTSILDPTTNSKLAKDMERLLAIKSGKFANWNQQTFNALKSDLALSSPKNVAPHLSTSTPASSSTSTSTTAKPVYQAQVLGGYGSTPATAQPTPAPEPGTLAIFGLATVALVWRLRRGQ